MIPGLRVYPLDRTVERDGVCVILGHAAMLTFEAMVAQPGQPLDTRDMLLRVYGPRNWAKRRFDSGFHARVWTEIRKAAAALGLRLVESGPGFTLEDATQALRRAA